MPCLLSTSCGFWGRCVLVTSWEGALSRYSIASASLGTCTRFLACCECMRHRESCTTALTQSWTRSLSTMPPRRLVGIAESMLPSRSCWIAEGVGIQHLCQSGARSRFTRSGISCRNLCLYLRVGLITDAGLHLAKQGVLIERLLLLD